MDKVNVTKDGVTQVIKHRYLQNFLDRGWNLEGAKPKSKKKSAVDYTVEATADVIEEETPPTIVEEEESSMPTFNQGEE